MKTLITYFSASGITKKVAERIKDISKSDIFEIEPKEKYSKLDLLWINPKSRSSVEMKDKTSRVEIKNKINIDKYDIIYIGFPVWWYTCPHIINTFLESYNFENKIVRLFCTSGSTDAQTVFNSIKEEYNFIKDCKRLTLKTSDDEIKEWLKI